jgi:very-short-patch-repair endonuclease
MTDAERKLWRILRGRQISGYKFRRQHPYEGNILDFVCLERKLIIEVDGGQHSDTVFHDEQRTRLLEQAGFKVLRFWNHEVLRQTEAVQVKIWQALENGKPIPTPALPLKGRERMD